jgi:hypothetical protein
LEQAVALSLPDRPHANDRAMFDLARRIKAFDKRPPAALQAFDLWHQQTKDLGFLRAGQSYQKYRDEFLHSWGNAWAATDAVVRNALAEAKANPLPPEASQFKNREKQLLLALCWRLDATIPDWFLSCRVAGKLLEVPHMTAWSWLRDFQRRGILRVAQEATAVKACRYEYIKREQ